MLSRPLGPRAKAALIDFVEAYVVSMKAGTVDETAEIAKEKAKAVLATDIDILSFAVTMGIFYSSPGVVLISRVLSWQRTSREVATALVYLTEQSRRFDEE